MEHTPWKTALKERSNRIDTRQLYTPKQVLIHKCQSSSKQLANDRFIPYKKNHEEDCLTIRSPSDVYRKISPHDPSYANENNPPTSISYKYLLKESQCIDNKIPGYNPTTQLPSTFIDAMESTIDAATSKLKMLNMHKRKVSNVPVRVLDAPKLIADYKLKLIDWSPSNLVAISLENKLYFWNAVNIFSQQSIELEDTTKSILWCQKGRSLAVGTDNGQINVIDPVKSTETHAFNLHSFRPYHTCVQSMAYNSIMDLLACSGNGMSVKIYDLRAGANPVFNADICRKQEYLSFSEGNGILSTAGKGINLWSIHSLGKPINPVKLAPNERSVTLAWCPYNLQYFATGGTSEDASIKIWDSKACKQVASIKNCYMTRSLLWGARHKELIVGNDSDKYHITFVSVPQYEREAEISGYDIKVVNMCMNPAGTEILASTSTEALWFWKIDEDSKKDIDSKGISALAIPR